MLAPLLALVIAQPQAQAVTKITFERTVCKGHCPSYRATLYPDGTVEYTGTRNVPKIGAYKATLQKDDWKHLVDAADKLGFYTAKSSDEPTRNASRVKSSITRGGKTYATDYLTNPPTAIWAFNRLLESSIAAAYDWRKAK